jgi:homopolymeric O-antigen transport system ATP-binding protein
MSDAAVRVDNLGKYYRIGAGRQAGQGLLREALSDLGRAPFRRMAAGARHLRARLAGQHVSSSTEANHIWALRNVSFEVARGQIVGIIGPNGAGKSTLLKILSRITDPTEGRAELRGRVGSLLEVGTGFHPELTGRENSYLSGALLGMRKVEIDQKLDEILAFAEIEKFADTPVKYYSSGMYVRLAFAVAAHLEPEILIVDEVLAVGDVNFQRKCLNKMEDVRQHGRTILFVSHNMAAVTRLCQRGILISNGVVQKDGPAAEVASAYLSSSLSATAERAWPSAESAPGDEVVRLREIRVRDEAGKTVEYIDIRRRVGLEMTYEVLAPGHRIAVHVSLSNESGVCLFGAGDLDPRWRDPRPVGRFTSTAWIPGNFLAEGAVIVSVAASSMTPFRRHFTARDVVAFHVTDPLQGGSARGDWDGEFPGLVRPLLPWTTTFNSDISPAPPP